jgi:VWFA-related protein
MVPLSPGIPGGRRQLRPLPLNRSVRRLASFAFGGLLLAGLTPALSARQAPAAPPEPFGERIEVRAINVETVVTDGRGRRVPGLTADDFELRVDGKPVPLEFFQEIRGAQAVAPAGPTAIPQPSLPPATAAGAKLPFRYLVFIDELFSPIARRKAALKKLIGELDRLGPDDRMAIVAVGAKGLAVLSPWSRSKDQLAAALQTGWQRTGYLSPFAPSAIDLAEDSVIGADNPPIAGRGRALALLREHHFERTLAAAVQAQRAFADTPGRKVMLFVSGNWVWCPEGIDRLSGCDASVRPLIDASNLLGYTVYPVRLEDALDTLPGAERREQLRPGEEIRTAGLTNSINDQIPMAMTAGETGGLLLSMSERYLAHAAEDLSSYYWLGFSADALGDGRRRAIEVRVKGQKYKVRTRSNYLPLSQQAEAALKAESALVTGQPPPRSRPLEIARHPLQKAARNTANLPLDLTIPVQELTLLPEGEGFRAHLELHTLAIDQRGDRSPMSTVPIELRFKNQPRADGKVAYRTTLALRSRPQKIEVQLADSVSGNVLTAQLEVAAADLPVR